MADTTNTIGFLCTPRVDRILTHEDLGLDLNSFIVFLHSLKFSEKVSLQYCNSSHLIILFKRFLINNEMLDRYETQSLDQYLRNISGILTGSLMNASIVLNKILQNFYNHRIGVRVITPFSLNLSISDDEAYSKFLAENGVAISCLDDSDIKPVSGVTQSFHFDFNDKRYVLWGQQSEIKQVRDFDQKLLGLRNLVIEGVTYSENIATINKLILKAKQRCIDINFVLSGTSIIIFYKENLLEQIYQQRINTLIGSQGEITTLLGDENYLQIHNFCKNNITSIFEINEDQIRFISSEGKETFVAGKFREAYKDFIFVGFLLGNSLGYDVEKSLQISAVLGSLSISIPDIFHMRNADLLEGLRDVIPNAVRLLTRDKTEQIATRIR